MSKKINVVFWNEFVHEKTHAEVRAVYPDGLHAPIVEYLNNQTDMAASFACLEMPEHGLTQAVLDNTDVLLWWGHMAHDKVDDAVVARVQQRVIEGMGLIVLHSGHFSKIFRTMMGTTCSLRWHDGEQEVMWNIAPGHPITDGIGDFLYFPEHEMYGERFDIPEPDKTIFISAYSNGNAFRSGCCFCRGNGRIFYFSPGHETNPIYHRDDIKRIIMNAVRWTYNAKGKMEITCPHDAESKFSAK